MTYDTPTRWVELEGYLYRYRLGDNGAVERWHDDKGWVQLKPSLKTGGNKRVAVYLTVRKGVRKRLVIARAVAEHFMGGIPKGYCVAHKNGSKLDCACYNLYFTTNRELGRKNGKNSTRRPVVKIDEYGNVLEIYPSIVEASKKNFMSMSAIMARLNKKVKYPFRYSYFTFKYDERRKDALTI